MPLLFAAVSSMLGAVIADLWKRFVLSLLLLLLLLLFDSKYFIFVVFVFGIFSLFTSFDCLFVPFTLAVLELLGVSLTGNIFVFSMVDELVSV